MDPDDIRLYPAEIVYSPREKPPPSGDSDMWPCLIGGSPEPLTVYMHNRAKRTVLLHALQTPNVEVGGAILGGVYTYQMDGHAKSYTYVEITHAVRGDFTVGSSVRLTFTPDTWSQIITTAEREFPGELIVGWYHTHPGHGVFLSEHDKFIQNSFFAHNNLLALVVDHINGCAGFFVGSEQDRWGIRASRQFSWDNTLYQLQHPNPTAADSTARFRAGPSMGSEATHKEAPALPPSNTRTQPPPNRYSQPVPYDSPSLTQARVPEQENVLKIDTGYLRSPEVQQAQRAQELANATARESKVMDVIAWVLIGLAAVFLVASAMLLLTGQAKLDFSGATERLPLLMLVGGLMLCIGFLIGRIDRAERP